MFFWRGRGRGLRSLSTFVDVSDYAISVFNSYAGEQYFNFENTTGNRTTVALLQIYLVYAAVSFSLLW